MTNLKGNPFAAAVHLGIEKAKAAGREVQHEKDARHTEQAFAIAGAEIAKLQAEVAGLKKAAAPARVVNPLAHIVNVWERGAALSSGSAGGFFRSL